MGPLIMEFLKVEDEKRDRERTRRTRERNSEKNLA
jgi:hypothetical protein